MLKQLDQGWNLVWHFDPSMPNLPGVLASTNLAGDYRNLSTHFARLVPIENVHTAISFETRKVENIAECDPG